MGRITSSIGLVTGVPIQDTVDQLVALQARARDLVVARNTKLQRQQVAVTELSALLLAFQITTNNLGKADLFQSRSITSSQPTVLSATSSGQPPLGTYQFTPLQTVSSQQLLSSGVSSTASLLGTGSLSFRFGGFVNEDTSLDLLGGGAGLTRGKIRITDRSGASSEIDLRFARTVEDVARAINENATINVRLETRGDRFRLVDQTGGTASNLKVQEVGAGTTAASLGLAGIDVAATAAEGTDIVRLFNNLDLNRLNDSAGLRFNETASDLQVSFRDGSSPLAIDFRRLAVLGTQARATTAAAAGINAQVTIAADTAGSAYDGVSIIFQNDNAVTAGDETVAYDSNAKTLTFKIDEGNTTANQVIETLNSDAAASALFTASRPTGGSGVGLVAATDTAVTAGPPATGVSTGLQGANAKVLFTAVAGGEDFDNVTVSFVDNAGVAAGSETVVYDDSNPNDKKLVFQIDAGNTTAANVIAALNADPTASQVFTASLASGSNGSGPIDVADIAATTGGAIVEPRTAGTEATLAGLLATINAADPARLKAQIAASGDRLELIDLTTNNGGTFAVTALNGSQVAADLGITGTAVGDTLGSRRLLAGLQTSLLASFSGGAGLGTLGDLQLTDRSGATATVDLSTAETLQDAIDAINASGLGITARVNDARNGLQLTDTTGATASPLIVGNGDATLTADKLKLTYSGASGSVNSGSLQRRAVSENTKLSTLNGGAGVAKGTLRLFDTNGGSATINLGNSGVETIGDVLDEINRAGLEIDARINDAGDGILLIDTGGGASTLRVAEGGSSAAADLHLLGAATTIDIGGTPTKVIDGSTTFKVELTATDTLQTLVDKINGLSAGVAAGVFNDGSSLNPVRLTLLSQRAGRSGQLLLDASQANLTFEETARAQDAVLLYGNSGSAGGGILATSSSNAFNNVVPGITLQIQSASTTSVSVTVAGTDTSLVANVLATVENYNRLRKKINDITAFDAERNVAAVLQGDGNVLRVEADLNRLLGGRFFGAGSIQTLETLGLSLNDDGTLAFEQAKLQAKFAADPEAVTEFFTAGELGFSAKLKRSIEQLAGEENSLLSNRLSALEDKFADNTERIETMNARLESNRELLLSQFFRAELAISKIQANLTLLGGIGPLSPIATGSSNS